MNIHVILIIHNDTYPNGRDELRPLLADVIIKLYGYLSRLHILGGENERGFDTRRKNGDYSGIPCT